VIVLEENEGMEIKRQSIAAIIGVEFRPLCSVISGAPKHMRSSRVAKRRCSAIDVVDEKGEADDVKTAAMVLVGCVMHCPVAHWVSKSRRKPSTKALRCRLQALYNPVSFNGEACHGKTAFRTFSFPHAGTSG
jgi:hypothetical protein